jgi:hypothetical protein
LVLGIRVPRKARHLAAAPFKIPPEFPPEASFGTGDGYFHDREEGNGVLNSGAPFFRAHKKTLENSDLLTGIMLYHPSIATLDCQYIGATNRATTNSLKPLL